MPTAQMATTKKNRQMIPEKVYDQLLGARTADKVTVHFKDGRAIHGALVFNPLKGTGRVINVETELSVDFAIENIRDLKFN